MIGELFRGALAYPYPGAEENGEREEIDGQRQVRHRKVEADSQEGTAGAGRARDEPEAESAGEEAPGMQPPAPKGANAVGRVVQAFRRDASASLRVLGPKCR